MLRFIAAGIALFIGTAVNAIENTSPVSASTMSIATNQKSNQITLTLPIMNWSGDFRYRAAQYKEDIDDARPLQQIRFRLGFNSEINSDTRAVVRLATATSAISSNQTLGDSKDPGMARRSFGLDQAYIDWRIAPPLKLWLGRTANPFYSPGKIQLVYDSDLAFEGLALKFEPKWSQSSSFINLGAFMISENFNAPDDVVDTGLVAAQIGYSLKSFGTWTVHAATHQYINVQNRPITSVEKDAKTDPYSYPVDRYRGNSVYPNDPLLPADQRKYFFKDLYVITELGGEWLTHLGPVDLSIYYDDVFNNEADIGRHGYETGINIKWGRAQLGYAWILKESDAVMAMFTDSDSNGGGTDGFGVRLTAAYQLSKNSQFAVSDFHAKRGIGSVTRDFSQTFLDGVISF